MNVDDLIKKIQKEQKRTDEELQSTEGLARLQQVMEQYQGDYELVWSDDLLKEIQERPQKPIHNTGVANLDELTGGFREQQLITISAGSKHGKTAFGIFLMDQMEHLKPVLIPLEQSNEEIVEQRYENGHSIPRFLSPRNLAAKMTVEWIEHRIIEGIAKYGTKMVVIDHLGYIDDFGDNEKYKKENLAYRIQQIMQGLKMVAKRWNVVIMLQCHISQTDESNPPTRKDLKNSSAIEQESDIVILLWRKNYVHNKVRIYDNKVLVSIPANRRTGGTGNIGLTFNNETGMYDEDDSWVKQMEAVAEQEAGAEDEFNNM